MSNLDVIFSDAFQNLSRILKIDPQNKKCPTCGGGNRTSSRGGANVNQGDANQTPNLLEQAHAIDPTKGSSTISSIGAALKHPVQINHDAGGVGVNHAAMLIHPEWNHDMLKSKIDAHLRNTNWKPSKNEAGGKTYVNSSGHKIHVNNVGKHLVIASDDNPKAQR